MSNWSPQTNAEWEVIHFAIRDSRTVSGTGKKRDGSRTAQGLKTLFNELPILRQATHQHLAVLLCTNREAVTRGIKFLKQEER